MCIMNRLFSKCAVLVLLWSVLLPFQGYSTTISYQYDSLNRLTKVRYGGGAVISYSYDPAGNRLSRTLIINGTSILGDMNDDGFISLDDAILALQVVSGLKPAGIRPDYAGSGAGIGGNQTIGLEEAIFILQKAALLR
jgi:YD repeat-containing protein